MDIYQKKLIHKKKAETHLLNNIETFLQNNEGKDLIRVVSELKRKFSLTDKGVYYVMKKLGYV